MTDTFDKILASRPVNKQAARTMGRGVHFESTKRIVQRYWTEPPKCRPIPPEPTFRDYTGKTVGRLTAVGWLGKGFWLVRCACGGYQARRSRSFDNPNNQRDRCDKCRETAALRMREALKADPTLDKHILDY